MSEIKTVAITVAAKNPVGPECGKDKICVVTKNGNFYQAVKTKTAAIAELRSRIEADLGIKTKDINAEEKNGVLRLAGCDYWRAKVVDLS